MQVLGVFREKEFSNKAVEADRAILEEVLQWLESHLLEEVEVTRLTPKQFLKSDWDGDLILSMAQGQSVLDKLESHPAVKINSVSAIRNCMRSRLVRYLLSENIPCPPSKEIFLDSFQTDQSLFSENGKSLSLQKGLWLKRGDFHALDDQDVLYAPNEKVAFQALKQFQKRGVTSVLIQEHVHGHVLKFYATANGFFSFRWMEGSFRGEIVPDKNPPVFNQEFFKSQIIEISKLLGLEVFGGDAVITSSGQVFFIDINDWPSFRTCRNEASHAIASYALARFIERAQKSNSFAQAVF